MNKINSYFNFLEKPNFVSLKVSHFVDRDVIIRSIGGYETSWGNSWEKHQSNLKFKYKL